MDKLLCLADLIYVKDVEISTHEGRFMLFLSSDRYNKKKKYFRFRDQPLLAW